MGLDMFLSYRRNLDGIPETVQRAMRKQVYIDSRPYTHMIQLIIENDMLDSVIDRDIKMGKPYEERIMYWREANAIHKFIIDNCANGIDDGTPIQITIDVLKNLFARCETILGSSILKSYIADDGSLTDPLAASLLLPLDDGFVFASDYDKRYVDTLKETVKVLKPIVEHPELYTDPIIYESSW